MSSVLKIPRRFSNPSFTYLALLIRDLERYSGVSFLVWRYLRRYQLVVSAIQKLRFRVGDLRRRLALMLCIFCTNFVHSDKPQATLLLMSLWLSAKCQASDSFALLPSCNILSFYLQHDTSTRYL
jgi:hypothetical protein